MNVVFYQEMNLDTIGLAMLVSLITVVVPDDRTDVKSVDIVDILMGIEVIKIYQMGCCIYLWII